MTPIDYIRIDADILQRHDLSDKAKMILGLIKSFNSNGLMMSNSDLAKVICCSEDYIGKLLVELKAYIAVKNPQSRYRKIFYSVQTDGVHSVQTDGVSNSTPSYSPAIPSISTATPSKSTDITKKNLKKKNHTALFEKFWKAYPKKVSKEAARKAFKKLDPTESLLDEVLKALSRQKISLQWTKANGQYIPYPATWLNGRRWEDEADGIEVDEANTTRELNQNEAAELLRKVGIA